MLKKKVEEDNAKKEAMIQSVKAGQENQRQMVQAYRDQQNLHRQQQDKLLEALRAPVVINNNNNNNSDITGDDGSASARLTKLEQKVNSQDGV